MEHIPWTSWLYLCLWLCLYALVYSFVFCFIRSPPSTLSFSSLLIFSRLSIWFSCFHSVCKFFVSFRFVFFFLHIQFIQFSYCSLSVIRFNFIYSFHSHVIHFLILSLLASSYAADSVLFLCVSLSLFLLLHIRSHSLSHSLAFCFSSTSTSSSSPSSYPHNKFSLLDSKTWNKNKIWLSK